ncbi:MAG: class I SAM-dependent methyltransferase [Terrimicrobiaceae bacterium]
MPLHRVIYPRYKITLIEAISRLLPGENISLLDLGAGDGLFASSLRRFLPLTLVEGVDITNRLHPKSNITFSVYDGKQLPFTDREFDVVLICNVLHHVPVSQRSSLIAEVSRVARQCIVIKDHLVTGPFSRISLGLADWVGNAPFRGMVEASYLSSSDWLGLLDLPPFTARYFNALGLQRGLRNLIFPDRQEIMIQLLRKD